MKIIHLDVLGNKYKKVTDSSDYVYFTKSVLTSYVTDKIQIN